MTTTATNEQLVEQVIEDLRTTLPKEIAQIRWEFDEDWSGTPSATVWVIVKDAAARGKAFEKLSFDLWRRINDAILATNSGYYPSVRFRSLSGDRNIRRAAKRAKS